MVKGLKLGIILGRRTRCQFEFDNLYSRRITCFLFFEFSCIIGRVTWWHFLLVFGGYMCNLGELAVALIFNFLVIFVAIAFGQSI